MADVRPVLHSLFFINSTSSATARLKMILNIYIWLPELQLNKADSEGAILDAFIFEVPVSK